MADLITRAAGSVLAVSTLLGSGAALAHGAHAPAEGAMHVVAHMVESLDQPLLFACVIGLIVAAVAARKVFRDDQE